MIVEMIHTSAPAGLHGRHGGFTVVAATRAAPPRLIELLEPMSAFAPGPGEGPAFALRRLQVGRVDWAVLTRFSTCGLDHTGRGNRIAHHVAFDGEAQRQQRIAPWLLAHRFLDEWTEPPRELDEPTPPGDATSIGAWSAAVGDDAWITIIAERCAAISTQPITVLLPPATDLRAIAAELLERLAPAAAWRMGFATRWDRTRPDSSMRLRLLRDDDPSWPRESIRSGPTLLDLRDRPSAPRTAQHDSVNRTPTPTRPAAIAGGRESLAIRDSPTATRVSEEERPPLWLEPINDDAAYEFHDPGLGTRRGLVVLLASVAAGSGLGILLEALDLIGTGS